LFNSDLLTNKTFNLKTNTSNNINNDDDDSINTKTGSNKESSKLLQKKRNQKLLNEDDQQNILNAFTKVNEFKNNIITKKIISNNDEESILDMSKTDCNNYNNNNNKSVSKSPNILIKNNLSQTTKSPIPFDHKKVINENKVKKDIKDIPLKIKITDLKKTELSTKEKGI